MPFGWLPVPSTTPVTASTEAAAATRALYAEDGVALVGHFGTYGGLIAGALRDLLPRLLSTTGADCVVLLMGQGGEALRAELLGAHPRLASRVHATGTLSPPELSRHLAACDLLVQPYPDGVSTRRTSVMAGLAHGLAVVTTAGRLTEPLWGESRAVALAQAEDDEALLDEVRGLLSAPEERARLGAAARELYRERFDLPHAVASLRRGTVERAAGAAAVGAGAEA